MKHKGLIRLWSVLVLGPASMLAAIILTNNRAQALTISSDVSEKFQRAIVQQCYLDNQFKPEVSIGAHISEKDIISGNKTYLSPSSGSSTSLKKNCRDTIFGDSGVLAQHGTNVNFNNANSIGSALTGKLQYSENGSKISQRCIYIKMTPWDFANNVKYSSEESNKVCVEVESDGVTIASDTFTMGDYGFTAADSGIHISTAKKKLYAEFINGDATDSGIAEVKFEKGDSLIDVANKLKNSISSQVDAIGSVCTAWQGAYIACNNGYVFENGDNVFYDSEASEATMDYKLEDGLSTDAFNASVAIFGAGNLNVLKSNAIALYQEYLADAQSKGNIKITCPISEAAASGGGYTLFTMVYNGAKTQCGARDIRMDDSAKYVGLQSNLSPKLDSKLSLKDILSQLTTLVDGATDTQVRDAASAISNQINPDQPTDGGTLPDAQVPDSTTTGSDDDGSGCLKSGVAGSLGWVLCPILKGMSKLASGLYSTTIEPNLKIEPELFSSSEGGTKQGWDLFQGMANILLIALFLVVIFSQLTGVGIDNYGIKRTLPKIILVAILMNISFYLCELAIDISNISGVGIQNLFENLKVGQAVGIKVDSVVKQIGEGTLTSVAVAAGGWGIIAAAGGIEVAFFTMLPAIISTVIAIFFLFIILAARQAAVVVLVVISPLAFVCYTLPNTKKFFDRWVKVMEALLLVFPICSLLVAGGDYVSRLLLASGFASDSFIKALTAMIVGIAPIFFIPSVLKKSMDGLGGLGNKISNMGGRLGNRAAGGVRNSDLYQSALGSAKERRNMQLSGKRWNTDTGKWENDPSRLGRLRRSIYNSGIGKAAGWDRLEGRRSQRAEVDRSTAETERQNRDVDIMNAQAEKNMETYDNRQGDAAGYVVETSGLTKEERDRRRVARMTKARDDTMDRLATQRGDATAHQERNEAIPERERREALMERQAGMAELARQGATDRMTKQYGDAAEALDARRIEERDRAAGITDGLKTTTMTDIYARSAARAERMKRQGQVAGGVANTNLDYERGIARNAVKMQQSKINAGAPELKMDTLNTIANNEVLMTNAQQEAGVAAIDVDIAKARAEASRDSQEYKLAYDQFANMDKAGRQAKLTEMLGSANGGVGREARVRAAFDALYKAGDTAETFKAIEAADLTTMDTEKRKALAQAAATSGNAFLKGWAKTEGAISLTDYKMSTSDDPNMAFGAYVKDKAGENVMNTMDKDTLEFLSDVKNPAANYGKIATPAEIKNALVTAANQNQTSRNAVVEMARQSGKLAEIGAEFSPADLTKLSLEAAQTLGADNLKAAVDEINKPGNETLRATIKDSVKKTLGIVDDGPAGSPAPDGGPAPGGGPEGGSSGGGPAPAPETGPVPTGGPAPAPSGSDSSAPGGDFESQYFERYGGNTGTPSGSDTTPVPDTTSGSAPESQQPAQPRQQPSPSAAEIARERTGLKTWAPVDILRNAINNGTGVFLDAAAEELASRPRVPLTRDDLTSMTNPTILRKLIDSGNPNHIRSIVTASRDLENDPAALQALAPDVRYAIDEARTMRGMTGLPS